MRSVPFGNAREGVVSCFDGIYVTKNKFSFWLKINTTFVVQVKVLSQKSSFFLFDLRECHDLRYFKNYFHLNGSCTLMRKLVLYMHCSCNVHVNIEEYLSSSDHQLCLKKFNLSEIFRASSSIQSKRTSLNCNCTCFLFKSRFNL